MSSSPKFDHKLEAYRSYLVVLARGQIPTKLQSRLDASDIVQDTMLVAYRKRNDFRGGDAKEFAGWLRKILQSNLMDAIKLHQRQGRDIGREIFAPRSLDESAMQLEELLAADQSSPSVLFDKQQRSLQLAAAIESLPTAQRDVIVMRYSQAMSIADIATEMGKSTVAVAGLLKRGTGKLRESLQLSASPQPVKIDLIGNQSMNGRNERGSDGSGATVH